MLSTKETPSLRPAECIKPHHLYIKQVRNAFLRKGDPMELTVSWIKGSFAGWASWDVTGYTQDVFGYVTKPNNTKIVRVLFADYLARLRRLDDNDFIKLDIGPDGICNSCVFGRHCNATNYTGVYPAGDRVGGEEQKVNQITSALIDAGFEFPKDMVSETVPHIFYNHHGETLNNSQNPTPIKVQFPSLTVRVSALRSVLPTIPLPPIPERPKKS